MTKTLLFLHLLFAFLFLSGAVAAGIAQLTALRRDRPSEIALLFRTARIAASLGLWLASMILGGLGGRTARHARLLAERLAAEGDRPSDELRGLVGHRPSLLLSYASTAAILAIIVLMVWKPGA